MLGWDEENIIPPGTEMLGVRVSSEGSAEYDGGMIIKIADLPPNTEALRIYMS